MDSTKKPHIQFLIAGVTTEQFSIDPADFSTDEEIEFSLNFNFKQAENDDMIGVFLTIELMQNQKQLVLLEVACHFKIHPETWRQVILRNDGSLKLPLTFALHMATLTTGTGRGVLHARLSGTPFANYVLPAINLTEVINADVELRSANQS